jgi:hypothetical protein
MAEFIVTHRREAIRLDLYLFREKRGDRFHISRRVLSAAILQSLNAILLPIGIEIIKERLAELVARSFRPSAIANMTHYKLAMLVSLTSMAFSFGHLPGFGFGFPGFPHFLSNISFFPVDIIHRQCIMYVSQRDGPPHEGDALMTTLKEISAQTGLARSIAMYPVDVCGNGWRLYTLRRAKEVTRPLFALARAGNIDALADALRADGETAPRTIARQMIRAAKRAGEMPAVEWVRDDRNVRLGAVTLNWSPLAGEWRHYYMFGA